MCIILLDIWSSLYKSLLVIANTGWTDESRLKVNINDGLKRWKWPPQPNYKLSPCCHWSLDPSNTKLTTVPTCLSSKNPLTRPPRFIKIYPCEGIVKAGTVTVSLRHRIGIKKYPPSQITLGDMALFKVLTLQCPTFQLGVCVGQAKEKCYWKLEFRDYMSIPPHYLIHLSKGEYEQGR